MRFRIATSAFGLLFAATVLPSSVAGAGIPEPNPKRAVAPSPAVGAVEGAPVAVAPVEWPRAVDRVPVPRPRPFVGNIVARVEGGRVVPVESTAFAARAASGPAAELFAAAEEVTEGKAALAASASASARALEAEAPPILAAHGNAAASAFAAHGRRSGDLEAALDALRADRYEETIARRNALSDSLDRLIVDYFLVRAGTDHVTSAMVADVARRATGWPTQRLMRVRAEEALSRERPDAASVIRAMGGEAHSDPGVRLLARAHLQAGDRARAAALVRPVWHGKALGASLQAAFAEDFSEILTLEDHLVRVDKLVALHRLDEAKALKSRLGAGPRAYVDARVAAASGAPDARARLARVPSGLRSRPGHRLAEVEIERRAGNLDRAARLIGAVNRSAVVDGDAWWVETRIVARLLAEAGKGREAYRLVTLGFAKGREEKADEAFHAGWFALSHLKDGRAADRHFRDLEAIATTPISLSRASYWRGRAAAARGDAGAAQRHYRDAAAHGFTYYGQIARAELGLSGTGVPRAPNITAADRAAIARNDVAEAIRRLVDSGHGHRIWPLLEHLAETVPTAGQLALVTEIAEKAGYLHLAVMAAKEGQRRGLDVGRLAYPTRAIPRSARMPQGLDPALVYAIARQESLFNTSAVSPAGARGLMQVMPRTAATMARELGISHSERRLTTDPAHNATIGAAYLAKRLGDYDGSYILTFAAYNAGASRVAQWIGRFGDPRDPGVDPIRWVEEIPFPETRNYVMRVMENVQVYREALGTGGLAIAGDLARGRRS